MNTYQGLGLIESYPFNHNGKHYSIRVFSDGYTILVRAFEGAKEANGYSYSATLDKAFNRQRLQGAETLTSFIKAAKGDITEGRWEQLLEFLKSEKEST